ncbi:MAG: CoA transferase, partial [Desulfovibrionales bacterium]|nr:CoA transferase [Desulfovibrionales bacterium]
MDECTPVLNTGLRGFDVASSKICDVQGKKGKLIYRGYLIEDLAQKASFEEVCFLLLYERLPQKEDLNLFDARLKGKRRIPENLINLLKALPRDTDPMDVLQMATPLLIQTDENLGQDDMDSVLYSAENLIAGMGTLIATWERIRKGNDPIPPDANLGHAANFLYMLTGSPPDEETAHFFDVGLVLHAEHSFNASTFTARQVASTRAHIYAAISAAIGSLSGALHGGANVRVMEMLKKIKSVDKVEAYVQNILDTGGLIMGLGHAVYQTDDPRALILAPMSQRMGEIIKNPRWYELSKELEIQGKAAFMELVRNCDGLVANFSAHVLPQLGLDFEMLAEVNPRIVLVRMPAFGVDGPYAGAVGFGSIIEAMGGMGHRQGYEHEGARISNIYFPDPI